MYAIDDKFIAKHYPNDTSHGNSGHITSYLWKQFFQTKLLKDYARLSMNNGHLSDLTVLSIECAFEIYLEQVIYTFAKNHHYSRITLI